MLSHLGTFAHDETGIIIAQVKIKIIHLNTHLWRLKEFLSITAFLFCQFRAYYTTQLWKIIEFMRKLWYYLYKL